MPGTDLSKQNNSSSLPHWNCDLAYIGEAFISYRETQSSCMAPPPACCPSCLCWEGSSLPSRSSPSTPGPVQQALLCTSLTRSFVSWGRWNSWNQHCVQVCLAECSQRNLTNFFPRRMPDGALVVLHPTKQMWNCQAPMQVLSGLLCSTYSDRPKICSLLPSKLAIYSL